MLWYVPDVQWCSLPLSGDPEGAAEAAHEYNSNYLQSNQFVSINNRRVSRCGGTAWQHSSQHICCRSCTQLFMKANNAVSDWVTATSSSSRRHKKGKSWQRIINNVDHRAAAGSHNCGKAIYSLVSPWGIATRLKSNLSELSTFIGFMLYSVHPRSNRLWFIIRCELQSRKERQ